MDEEVKKKALLRKKKKKKEEEGSEKKAMHEDMKVFIKRFSKSKQIMSNIPNTIDPLQCKNGHDVKYFHAHTYYVPMIN